MELERDHLMVLLNGLHDLDQTSIPVAHPSDDIGTLVDIRLGEDDTATVTFDVNLEEFRETCDGIRLEYGDTPYRDLPSTTTLVKALTASGVIEFANQSRIESTVDRLPRHWFKRQNACTTISTSCERIRA